jgi:hypothetical protein
LKSTPERLKMQRVANNCAPKITRKNQRLFRAHFSGWEIDKRKRFTPILEFLGMFVFLHVGKFA